MPLATRLRYYSRIFAAYATPAKSHLTFWHETPALNSRALIHELGEYYMPFADKANYACDFDDRGIPLLNYHGRLGRQYNPIAIAQWGLGNYNLFCRSRNECHKKKFITASEWLCSHLEQNQQGVWVWNHHFDWDYRTPLKAPWYSALAQGQGMSLLVRAYRETRIAKYLDTADRVFTSFCKSTGEGGVAFTDHNGNIWFEEYIVAPPTHILNGFIWAMWGVYDYFLATRSLEAKRLFDQAIQTLQSNLPRYDLGFWSLYEQSGTWMPMISSVFYHHLHIVQLRIMHRFTGDPCFARFADKWESYGHSRAKRTRALCCKAAFKLCYY
jgi:heparosan-N-sulfate-glucuronate 5-epimerase